MFGEIASLLVKQQVLHSMSELASAIQTKLRKPRPRGRGLFVGQLNQIRDWKHWIEPLGISLAGTSGAGAAHSIRLMRRRGAVLTCGIVGGMFCVALSRGGSE
jgi:hypothetical protein